MATLPRKSPNPAQVACSGEAADRQERAHARAEWRRLFLKVAAKALGGSLLFIICFVYLGSAFLDLGRKMNPILLLVVPFVLMVLMTLWLQQVYVLLSISYDFYRYHIRLARCPECKRKHNGDTYIHRKAIPDTGREELTCSYCSHTWYQPLYTNYSTAGMEAW